MAIVGLLTAAQQISSAISNMVSTSKSAPKDMQNLKSTVDTIRSVLLQLQLLLLGRAKVDRQRTSLILVEQVVITLSACVATFSELDVFVESLNSDNKLGLMDRIRWVTKATTIQEHLKKLEMHKSSLTLMMAILTCESTYKAEDAVDELSGMIRQVLDNHQILAQRLLSIEIGLDIEQPLSSHLPQASEQVPRDIQRTAEGFAFEEVLHNSWVYQRLDRRSDGGAFSVISTAGRTASWTMLSGLSLSDNISIIAFQALPVYAHDLSNSEAYQFGEFNDSAVDLKHEVLESNELLESPNSRSIRGRLSRLAAGITARIPRKTSGNLGIPEIAIIPPKKVFGVELEESISFANVAIALIDSEGTSYTYGYVPIVVAKTGVYLKEEATNVENIFGQSGSAKRIYEVECIFDTKPRYGKGLDWAGYTVHDAASCLLRYLKLLPEPVIPFNTYEQFTAAVDSEVDLNFDQRIAIFQGLVTTLPPLSRQLLIYLLDLLAVFASKSETNLMTSQRLVAAFQPSLLSRPPSEMSADDHTRASDTMVFMVENQESFLV
ncbi:Rho GTPase activation protein [Amylocarpus encephaloides]|uniref:Rho GTPase activation protein n=1 Tax=Amylocarpus encephaloides TaxID=45428 RepID=A0A9P7YTR5_9HELO|nr:Rho GTPase activation protein [Amylocarpus encephaloides]